MAGEVEREYQSRDCMIAVRTFEDQERGKGKRR